MAEASRLQVVAETDEPFPTQPKREFASDVLLLALKTVSQRAIIGLWGLFSLATVISVFWLWFVTPDPNPNQLIKLAMYGAFVLAVNWIVRRR